MSENSPAENTGIVPQVSGNNANFQNVEVGTGETVATSEPLATAEGPPVEKDSNSNSPLEEENSLAPPPPPVENSSTAENMSASAPPASASTTYTSKKGKPMSQSQFAEQALRADTFKDMQAKYAERFGDKNMYKKAPKAKIYNAGRLSKVRRDQGEDAYVAELKKVMDRDDPLIAKNASLNTRKVKKNAAAVAPVSMPMNTGINSLKVPNVSAAANSARNAGSKQVMLNAFDEMAKTVKGLIDTMSTTAKTLAGELAKTNSAALPQLSNTMANASQGLSRNNTTLKAPKKRKSRAKTMRSNSGLAAPLPPLPEETSSNLLNAGNEGR